VWMLQAAPAEEEEAQKRLQEAKASARKAVSEAREVQSKLSIEENMRRAEEKAQIKEAENAWQKWFWIALGAGAIAIVVGAWRRRRN
jgi:CHASE3 domain sensor protein